MAGPEQFGKLNMWAMLKAMLNREVAIFVFDGAPVSGTSGTFAGKAGKGSLVIDYTNGTLYQNAGTKLSPTWTPVGSGGADIPLSGITPSAAASRLLGRGSASAGDWEPISLGANLTMTGTVLAAAGGAAQFTLGPGVAQAGDGALNPDLDQTYVITKGSAAALTLAAPINPGSNGKTITVTSNTAFAHTITTATLLDTGTALTTSVVFAAFAGASVTLMAWAGRWKIISSNAITLT